MNLSDRVTIMSRGRIEQIGARARSTSAPPMPSRPIVPLVLRTMRVARQTALRSAMRSVGRW